MFVSRWRFRPTVMVRVSMSTLMGTKSIIYRHMMSSTIIPKEFHFSYRFEGTKAAQDDSMSTERQCKFNLSSHIENLQNKMRHQTLICAFQRVYAPNQEPQTRPRSKPRSGQRFQIIVDLICFQRAEMKLLVCFNPMLIKTYFHLRNGCGEQNRTNVRRLAAEDLLLKGNTETAADRSTEKKKKKGRAPPVESKISQPSSSIVVHMRPLSKRKTRWKCAIISACLYPHVLMRRACVGTEDASSSYDSNAARIVRSQDAIWIKVAIRIKNWIRLVSNLLKCVVWAKLVWLHLNQNSPPLVPFSWTTVDRRHQKAYKPILQLYDVQLYDA